MLCSWPLRDFTLKKYCKINNLHDAYTSTIASLWYFAIRSISDLLKVLSKLGVVITFLDRMSIMTLDYKCHFWIECATVTAFMLLRSYLPNRRPFDTLFLKNKPKRRSKFLKLLFKNSLKIVFKTQTLNTI